MTLERFSHILTFENTAFIEFAGETPRGSEIDKDRAALVQLGLQSLGREGLPTTSEL